MSERTVQFTVSVYSQFWTLEHIFHKPEKAEKMQNVS